ncbi:hypothetical protein ACWGDS_35990 [Streptomyces sp. NPDC055059]|uniref:hypothetical protein n=1 Tax=unclassified Streptomyces TaxID=2593676 RepID=UPI0032478865
MRRRFAVTLAAVPLAALAVPLAAGPAAASEYNNWCPVVQLKGGAPTQTAYAHIEGDWATKYKLDPVVLLARDTYADGHNVGVRLITWQADGDVKYWSWHHYYGGDNGQDFWKSTASDTQGIKAAAVQGGVFEGSDLLASCVSSKMTNPIW